jgi:nucleoside-diphosphate-sugar epimerase
MFKSVRRFVNVSSFAVYSNVRLKRNEILDETCDIEKQPQTRGEAYCFSKTKQEELVQEYCKKYKIPFVIMRPGAVYGPGNQSISGRVGIDTFGIFLHMGGSNRIPFTYVKNCAEAIALGGLINNIDGEIFNIVDDDLPTSRKFLKAYKKNVYYFKSIYVPKLMSFFFCYLWEKYSKWSKGQLPPAFNRKRWSADWKGNHYSNKKLKELLGWYPSVSFAEGSRRYFEYCKKMRNFND